jgi:hypothetical protein
VAKNDEKDVEKQPVSRAQELRDVLRKEFDFGGMDDVKSRLSEALDQLAKIHRITFDIDVRAFHAENLKKPITSVEVANPEPIPPMKATVDTVLRRVLAALTKTAPLKSPATYLIRKDRIEITTEDAVREELGLPASRRDEEGNAIDRLPPLVWEEFSKVTLEQALRRIADATDVSVLLDPRAGEKAKTELTANLRNIPVETAVELLADMAGLAVVRRGNVLYVTSAENAQKLRKSKETLRVPQPAVPGAGGARK